jgi:WXG100 family type VII secretion target
MADTTKMDPEIVQSIVKEFKSDQEYMQALMNQTKSKVESLHGNQWIGQGADKFFDTMENMVLPKTGKMVYALGVAGNVLNQIMQTIQQADEETKGFFGNLG